MSRELLVEIRSHLAGDVQRRRGGGRDELVVDRPAGLDVDEQLRGATRAAEVALFLDGCQEVEVLGAEFGAGERLEHVAELGVGHHFLQRQGATGNRL